MPTYINPNVIIDHSITSAKLAEDISIGNSKMFYGICDTSAATTDKVVTCNSFAADDLVEGVMVSTKFNYTNSGAVANLTLAVNDTSAYPIKKIYGTKSNNAGITDLYQPGELSAGAVIPFIFTGSYWLIAGVDMNVNTTYTLNYSIDAGQYKAGNGTYAVTRYSLLMEKPDETWEKITDTSANYSTGTSKTVNPNGFLLNRIVYYATSTAKAGGTLLASNTCQHKAASVDMRYSTNCGTTPGWAVSDYVYLVGTLGADGLFYLDSTAWWTNALPNTDDGKLYIRLGVVLADTNGNPTYTISFLDDRLIFYHDGTSVKIYNTLGNSGDSADSMTSITYADLKALRDSSSLVPGMQYRITDYHCSTTQQGTSTADNQFDIIVTADSSTVLNENARAAKHTDSSTDYFVKCNLETWELKYSLDNNKERFTWADTSNGKGVIYYMKDEWNNECPYDFKNILFERYKIIECVKSPGLIDLYAKAGIDGIMVDEEQKFMVLTFCMIDSSDGTAHDVTVEQDVYPSDDISELDCYSKTNNNHISDHIDLFQDDDYVMILPDVVFVTDTEICSIEENYGGFYAFYNNHFGKNCLDNTFGNNCYNNTFGNNCQNNTFGNNCGNNAFGNFYCNNEAGNDYINNIFGNSCQDNTFSNYCSGNIFGNSCSNNAFGNTYYNNTFGNTCYNNTFGSFCYNNTLMNNCQNNSFGNSYLYNLVGNNCSYNTFGNYCQAITVFDNVQNCSVTGSTYQAPVKNAQILNGTAGDSSQSRLTIAFATNKNYTQVAAKTTAGALKIYNPADLV